MNRVEGRGLDSSGSRHRQVAGPCEKSNKIQSSIKVYEFLD